jgi:hypothetical protein
VPDYYSGVPILVSPGAIRERFARHGAVVILRDTMADFTARAVAAAVEREGVELCRGRCGSARVYYWRLDGRPTVEAGRVAPGLRP